MLLLSCRSVHQGVKRRSSDSAKELACDLCDYKTREARRLRAHVQSVHMGLAPFKCKYCDFTTRERTSLRDHTYRHYNQKPYSCNYCSYACIHRYAMKTHLKNTHRVDLPNFPKNLATAESKQKHGLVMLEQDKHMRINRIKGLSIASDHEYFDFPINKKDGAAQNGKSAKSKKSVSGTAKSTKRRKPPDAKQALDVTAAASATDAFTLAAGCEFTSTHDDVVASMPGPSAPDDTSLGPAAQLSASPSTGSLDSMFDNMLPFSFLSSTFENFMSKLPAVAGKEMSTASQTMTPSGSTRLPPPQQQPSADKPTSQSRNDELGYVSVASLSGGGNNFAAAVAAPSSSSSLLQTDASDYGRYTSDVARPLAQRTASQQLYTSCSDDNMPRAEAAAPSDVSGDYSLFTPPSHDVSSGGFSDILAVMSSMNKD